MAFASVGSLGSTNSKTASQTLAMSPTSAVPVGHLVAVFVAWEGDRGYTDGGGINDLSLACTDDAGNIYTELQSGLYDVSSSMFLTFVDVALTTSSIITITHRSSAQIAKAMSVEEFSIANGKRFAVWRDKVVATQQKSGDPAAMSISGLGGSTEYLLLHVLAANRPSSDSYTWDSDYTQITSDGTTGGADNTNVTLRGGWRIASLTSDTVDVTNDTSGIAPDCWQGFVAISEVDYDGSFPTLPNFDQFNRADEDPLANPPWSSSTTVTPGFGASLLRVVSNQCARQISVSGAGAMFWDETIPAGDDGEVFVTMANVGASNLGIHCFNAGSGQNSNLSGYAAYWIPLSDARPDYLDFGETGFNGGYVSEPLITWINRANGYKMGLQMRESGVVIHLWADIGAGWRWVSCWHKTSFVRNGGKFGLNFNGDSNARLDDFGGGTSIKGGPQIYRRV